MDYSYSDIIQRISESFSETDSDIVTELLHADTEYAALRQQLSEMKKKHRFIDIVLDGEGEIALTDEQHGILVQFFKLNMKIDNMERLQIYFRGHTDSYAYLKKIDALK